MFRETKLINSLGGYPSFGELSRRPSGERVAAPIARKMPIGSFSVMHAEEWLVTAGRTCRGVGFRLPAADRSSREFGTAGIKFVGAETQPVSGSQSLLACVPRLTPFDRILWDVRFGRTSPEFTLRLDSHAFSPLRDVELKKVRPCRQVSLVEPTAHMASAKSIRAELLSLRRETKLGRSEEGLSLFVGSKIRSRGAL